jgi:hypothetical protein
VRHTEYSRVDWRLDLRKLTEKWCSTGLKSRLAAMEIPNRLARSHMHGISDGLDVAADDVDTLLDKPDLPGEPSEEK